MSEAERPLTKAQHAEEEGEARSFPPGQGVRQPGLTWGTGVLGWGAEKEVREMMAPTLWDHRGPMIGDLLGISLLQPHLPGIGSTSHPPLPLLTVHWHPQHSSQPVHSQPD